MGLFGLGGLGGLLALLGLPEDIGNDNVESFLSGHCNGEGCPGEVSIGEASKGWVLCGCVWRDDANCEASRLSRNACCRSSGGPFSRALCTSSNLSLAARTEPFTGAAAPDASGTPFGLPGLRAALLIYQKWVSRKLLDDETKNVQVYAEPKRRVSVCSRQSCVLMFC